MTTIAYDGKYLATDSRISGDYIEQYSYNKISKVGAAYIACCGDVPANIAFKKWYKDQTKPKPDLVVLKDFEALIIRDKKVFFVDKVCEFVELVPPIAIGSGCKFAMGAMLAGASATEAIQIANKSRSEPCIMSLNVMTMCYDVRFDAEPETIYSLPQYLLDGYLKYWDKVWNDNPFIKTK
mgnify:CR=1 FL=1